MRFGPLLLAARLFAAAGGGTTIIDHAGNAWLTGTTGFMPTTPTAFQKTATFAYCGTQQISPFQSPTVIACQHAFLSEQDSSGNVLYATYLAGSSQDGGTALTSDAQGNIYVAGYTYSSDFPITPGVVQGKNAGPAGPTVYTELNAPFGLSNAVPGGDAFVAKFAPDGKLLFSTFLGGSGEDVPTLIAVDSAGSIYVAGFTLSTDFPVTGNALTGQGTNNFFARLNPTGTQLTYSTYYLSPILAFDVDNEGRANLTGNYVELPNTLTGQPYVSVLDTQAGTVVQSSFLPDLKPNLAGAGSAIAVTAGGDVEVAVSPAPQPYNFDYWPSTPARELGQSYLFELSGDLGALLAEIDVGQSQFDSILMDASGNAYGFGHGTGTIPSAPIQLLPAPCTPSGGTFGMEVNGGNILASTYFRQADDTAIAITAPGKLLLYRTLSSITVPMDISAQPAALFGCLENLATGLVGSGVAPGEIFEVTGTGLGPAEGIPGVPNAAGQYPTTLGGVQVFFGSTAAPLLYVSASEIHGVAPLDFIYLPVQVQYGASNPPPLDMGAAQVNPGIFEIDGQGAIINQDGTVNTPANPAELGSIVSVYCTGTGFLEIAVTDGSVAPIPPPYNTTVAIDFQLVFAGVAGTTLWSGAAPGLIEGVTQINVQLPGALPSGTALSAVPLVLNSGVVYSPPVAISVKQ